jgi:uncharacterized membrane protein
VNGHLHSLVFTERSVLAGHLPWMGWNLLLAAIPVLLAWVLFRPARRRAALWWLGLAVFVAFLPNAAYVLTDAVHLMARTFSGSSGPRSWSKRSSRSIAPIFSLASPATRSH